MGLKVNRAQLGEVFGVSLPLVDKWNGEGCPSIQKGGRGKEWRYDTGDVYRWLIDREGRAGKENDPDELEGNYKLRKLAAEAELAELELAKARDAVALIAEFEKAQSRLMATIQTRVLNVVQRVVIQLLGCTDEAMFKRTLRGELSLALEQAARDDIEAEQRAAEAEIAENDK